MFTDFAGCRTNSEASHEAYGRQLRFLANVDPVDVARALNGLAPETTLVVVVSKTFTTSETMLNARTVRQALPHPHSGCGCVTESSSGCVCVTESSWPYNQWLHRWLCLCHEIFLAIQPMVTQMAVFVSENLPGNTTNKYTDGQCHKLNINRGLQAAQLNLEPHDEAASSQCCTSQSYESCSCVQLALCTSAAPDSAFATHAAALNTCGCSDMAGRLFHGKQGYPAMPNCTCGQNLKDARLHLDCMHAYKMASALLLSLHILDGFSTSQTNRSAALGLSILSLFAMLRCKVWATAELP